MINISLFNLLQVERCHIKVELKDDSYTELSGEIAGPPDTPYEGATYKLDIRIPETYPFNPPKVCYLAIIGSASMCCLFCLTRTPPLHIHSTIYIGFID